MCSANATEGPPPRVWPQVSTEPSQPGPKTYWCFLCHQVPALGQGVHDEGDSDPDLRGPSKRGGREGEVTAGGEQQRGKEDPGHQEQLKDEVACAEEVALKEMVLTLWGNGDLGWAGGGHTDQERPCRLASPGPYPIGLGLTALAAPQSPWAALHARSV